MLLLLGPIFLEGPVWWILCIDCFACIRFELLKTNAFKGISLHLVRVFTGQVLFSYHILQCLQWLFVLTDFCLRDTSFLFFHHDTLIFLLVRYPIFGNMHYNLDKCAGVVWYSSFFWYWTCICQMMLWSCNNHFNLSFLQLLDALCLLYDAHVIHCDLKPENILLSRYLYFLCSLMYIWQWFSLTRDYLALSWFWTITEDTNTKYATDSVVSCLYTSIIWFCGGVVFLGACGSSIILIKVFWIAVCMQQR